jgi:multisubunit Na+/H+ antiporter MnhG subunit
MALVPCNLCNNRISTKAKSCPKCGCPNINRDETVITRAKNCNTCSYAPTEPGFTCNLCDVPATDSLKPTERAPSAKADLEKLFDTDSRNSSIAARIAELDISRDLKDVFTMIALSERDRGPLSEMPDGDDIRLKCFRAIDSRPTICSNLALFLGAAYYFIHGIWQKGSLLALIMLSPALLFFLSGRVAALILAMAALYVHVTCYRSAKRDRYRRQVLEERFWW